MKKRKVALFTYLILSIILCLLFAKRFLPFDSYGADDTKVMIESKLNKYINYNLSEDDKGTLVQYEIKTRVEYGEEVLPVSQRETFVNFSQIDGQYPNDVKVITQNVAIEENSKYDETTGILQITTNHQKEEEDYFVIGYYSIHTEESVERELQTKVVTEVTLADEGNRKISSEEQYNDKVIENIGELTSITSKTEDIYNGYIKSNRINGTNYATEYRQEEQIVISKKEEIDTIELLENNTFMKQEGEEIIDLGNNYNLVYKSTQIDKAEIGKLLGQEGTLEILDIEGNNLVTINQDTESNEDGTITINYENELEAIQIRTSQIVTEGILNLKHIKEIKSTMLDFQNVSVKTVIQMQGVENAYETTTTLKESQTTIKADIDGTNWTNEQQNEVTFDIKLDASTRKNNMFKNPSLRIELPSQVEKVIVGESSLVYGNGLELQDPYIETNENGNVVIVVNLIGEQTQYDENDLGLVANVKIATTIILKNDIESTEENINLTYSNQYTLDGSTEIGSKEIPVQLEDYREVNHVKIEQPFLYRSAQPLTQNTEAIKLEVAPMKGGTTLQNGDVVYEGEYIKYNLKVTNESNEDIQNVKVVATIPDGVTYGELETNYYDYRQTYRYNFQEDLAEKTIEIGTIKAGKSVDTFYEVKVDDLAEEEEKTIATNIKTYVGEQSVQNYDISNVIKPSEIELFLTSLIDYGNWCYDLNIKSEKEEEVTVNIHLPKGFELNNITYVDHIVEDSSDYNPSENSEIVYMDEPTVQINKLDIEVSEDNVITTTLKTNSCYGFFGDFDNSKIEKNENASTTQLIAYAEAILGENHYQSNENRIEKSYQSVSVSMTSDNNGEKVKYEDEVNYEISIKNTGGENVVNEDYTDYVVVNLSDFLPEEINPTTVTYDYWRLEENETGIFKANKMEDRQEDISGEITDEDGNKIPNVNLSILIPKGETATVKVEATAGMVFEETKIENKATVSGDKIEIKTTNIIGHTILPYDYDERDEDNTEEPDNPNKPENPDIPDSKKYSISGVAWIDKNEDGKRNSNEVLLEGMTVMLVDVADSNTVKSTTKTNNRGKYEFSNLEQNNYLVVFKYDTNKYKLTEYQKSGVSSSLNSDALDKTIMLYGKQEKVGITDAIGLSRSATNIDIGLIENKVCDFKIDKYINKVTVKTVKGTKEYSYSNKTLAKAEISAKEIEGATVTIEYKILITNVGEIAGTISEIKDYLPEGLNFSTAQNSSWNKGTNGELINASISNRKIEVGESVALTLIATKQMTANETGTFTNKVSIIEATDVNSKNNIASADIIISVSTGAIVYIAIAIFIVIILSIIVIYLYKKGKINIKKVNKTMFFVLFMLTMIVSSTSSVWSAYNDKQTFTYVLPLGSHSFIGGPTGGGSCMNHSLLPAGYDNGTVEEAIYDYQGASNSRNGERTLTRTGDFTLKQKNTIINMKILDDTNFIYGPFKFECSRNNVTYTLDVRNSNNQEVTNYTICDANGIAKNITTSSGKFYLKIPKISSSNGIVSVKLVAAGSVTDCYNTPVYETPWYFNSASYQPVESTGEVISGNISDTVSCNKSHEITWTDINGCLLVIKRDKDNPNLRLSGVAFTIQGEGVSRKIYDR